MFGWPKRSSWVSFSSSSLYYHGKCKECACFWLAAINPIMFRLTVNCPGPEGSSMRIMIHQRVAQSLDLTDHLTRSPSVLFKFRSCLSVSGILLPSVLGIWHYYLAIRPLLRASPKPQRTIRSSRLMLGSLRSRVTRAKLRIINELKASVGRRSPFIGGVLNLRVVHRSSAAVLNS
jgi:hypothetical protein